MPQRLHRLEVRSLLVDSLSSYGIPANHIVSREAGYIDVFVPRESNREDIKDLVMRSLSRRGIGIVCIDETYLRRGHLWRLRFQNDLMLQQAQWGARGMSRRHRDMLGIDTNADPADTGIVQGRRTDTRPVLAATGIERLVRQMSNVQREVTIHASSDDYAPLPTVEEVQTEPDTGILARVRVTSVALEASEIG